MKISAQDSLHTPPSSQNRIYQLTDHLLTFHPFLAVPFVHRAVCSSVEYKACAAVTSESPIHLSRQLRHAASKKRHHTACTHARTAHTPLPAISDICGADIDRDPGARYQTVCPFGSFPTAHPYSGTK